MLPFRQRLQPDGEHLLILLHVIAADKPDHRVLRRYDRMDGHFRFFALGINNGFAVRDCAVHGAAVEDHAVDRSFMQAAIERFLRVAFGKEFRMPHFYAVGEIKWQGLEKLPEGGQVAWAKRGGKLEPVLANTVGQRRHPGEKLVG